jgi:hypothetical protein
MVFRKRACRKCGREYFGNCPCGGTDRNRFPSENELDEIECALEAEEENRAKSPISQP